MFSSGAIGRIALLAMLVLASSNLWAEMAPLSLRDALSRTLESNPELAAYQHVLTAQDGRVRQAGLRPNPSLETSVENVLGTGDAQGLSAAEVTLGLSQLIELGGLRDKRVAFAESEKEQLRIQGQIGRLDVLAETARRFVMLVSQQESHQLTHLAVALSSKTADAVERRVTSGKAPLAERDRAAVALERAKAADDHAKHELLAGRHDLAASWGESPPSFGEASADLYDLPKISDYQTLVEQLDATPDIEKFLSEQRMLESEIELAMASRIPGIELGAGVRRLLEARDTALVFSASIPLPYFNRNQGLIAEAEARMQGAAAQRHASRVAARAQLFRNYRELLDRERALTALRKRALPRMESALRNTEYAFERGRYSYLELVDAQRELLALRGEIIEVARQYHLTLIEIERLTGVGLSLRGPRDD